MKLLVTGGTGAIGSMVLRELVEQGHEVVSYDLRPDLALLKDIAPDFQMVTGDVLDHHFLLRSLREYRVEGVVHMAAYLAPGLIGSQSQPFPNRQANVNITGLINVLEAAQVLDIPRVVFISSKAVYGDVDTPHHYPDYVPVSETYRLNPNTVYGASKVLGEQLGLAYAATGGLEFVALRLSLTYGPGKLTRHGKAAGISPFVESAIRGEGMTCATGADERMDLIYNRDVAKAVRLAVEKRNVESGIYNVGTGEAVSMSEIKGVIEAKFGVSIEIGPGLDPFQIGQRYFVMDMSKTRQAFAFEPSYTLSSGIEDYAKLIEKLGLLTV